TAWKMHRENLLDGLVVMYHDQAMIPLKVLDSRKIVNWTMGLPFIRTSPGHGTAFDIAGKGKADPQPMIEAILLAAKLVKSASAKVPGSFLR
ncbi:MAG: 4-hydroxythreonine-4-phosphate dehydrogenase PdxA, partial [Elusimicrobia bacterium]|nr:4-hydroxythreonine-4-phosphate dehydrogenase PdxA [Elusimicrobiota bacterium]